MKKHITFLAIAALLFAGACGDDEEPQVDNGSGSTADEITVVGTATTFTDPDTDAESRTWSVSPSTGVDLPADLGSSSVTITFNQPGDYTVTSTRTFGSGFVNPTNTLAISVEVFDVVEAVVEAVAVRNDGTDGAAFTMADGAANVIAAGQTVRYINNSTGDPSGSSWTFEGGTPGTASNVPVGGIVDVVYDAPGSYGITVTAEQTASGAESTSTVSFTGLVEVVAPMTLNNIMSLENANGGSSLALNFSKTVDASSLADATFSVDVVNMGVPASIAAANVSISPDSESTVWVELAEEVLASDSLLINYSGNIADAVDGALADNFSQLYVDNYKMKVAGRGGFESIQNGPDTTITDGFAQLFLYGVSFGQLDLITEGTAMGALFDWAVVSTEDKGASSIEPNNGSGAAHFQAALATDVTDLGTGFEGLTWDVEEGKTYMISVMVDVKSSGLFFEPDDRCPDQTEEACIKNSSFDIFLVNYAGWGNIDEWDLVDFEGQGYTQLTTTFVASETTLGTYPFLRMFGIGEIVVDDLYIVEVEPR
ncbi:MAG: PKD domain-containing protein [Bacteroidota bacterium]